MNKKLYIIFFEELNDDGTIEELNINVWSETSYGALRQVKSERFHSAPQIRHIKNAVHKDDVVQALNRYILKPLSK